MNNIADQYSDLYVREIMRLHGIQGLSYQMKTPLLLPGHGRVKEGDEYIDGIQHNSLSSY